MDNNGNSGWGESKRLIEYRLDQTDRNIKALHEDVKQLSGSMARVEERTKVHAGIVAGVVSAVSAGFHWLLKG